MKTTLENCTNLCDIVGTTRVGGICGYNGDGSLVVHCKNVGTISGEQYTGGIVGWSSLHNSSIEACFNTGKIRGNDYVAGILGGKQGSVRCCVNAGEIRGNTYVAGIYGYVTGCLIENCYNLGSVYGNAPYGVAVSTTAGISCCYNVGALYSEVGGTPTEVVAEGGNGIVTYCYYLSGVNPGANANGTVSLTEDEMASAGSFIGFDFINIWTWDSTGTYNYPILREVGLVLAPCGEDAHVWDDGVETDAPTCTTEGKRLLTCTKCQEKMSRPIPALGHNEVVDPEVPVGCTKSGLTEGSHCDRETAENFV